MCDTLPLPTWFKEEVEKDAQEAKEASWLATFDRYACWGSDPNMRDRVLERTRPHLAEYKDRPKGLKTKVLRLLRFVKNADRYVLVVAVGALLYFVSPIDAIPDFIAGVGLTDDLFILSYALKKIGWITKKDG